MPLCEWTVVFSGPQAQRGPLLAAFQRAGFNLTEGRFHSHGLPDEDPTVGFVSARVPDVDQAVAVAGPSGWALRMHWNTPACPVCAGNGQANIGAAGLGTCLHCSGSGRTNKPAPAQPSVADLLARIEALEVSR